VLTGFTAGLLLITISELGDKTFFIAVILAMRHSRKLVFVGVASALATMTILSVMFGKVVSLLPQTYLKYGEIILFLAFGIKLLYEASKMSDSNSYEEIEEAKEAVAKADLQTKSKTPLAILIEAFTLTFVAEWGDRTQLATGAVLGHAICTAIAVIGGKLIAGRISERQLTFIGGCLFIIFGVVAVFKEV
jgi:Ca2+/H+ antiporter, TMEM165/GDT1 family